MPISQNHHDLFHSSGASDKLDLFQMLLNSRRLNSDEALALLNTIHTELGQSEGHDPSLYVRYVRMMEALRQQMPQVHQEVTAKWAELHSGMQKKVTEDYASEVGPEKNVKRRTAKYETPTPEKIQQPGSKSAKPVITNTFPTDETEEIRGGEEELEGPEPEEEEAEEAESSEKEEKEGEEETEKYGEEVEEEEAEEKEEENEKEETEVEEAEGAEEKEEENEKEEEKEETEEKEEEDEKEEVEEEKEEVEEKEEKEEVEEKEQEEETESEAETAESTEEADHMISEAAEAAEEAERPEVEVEETQEAEEINPGKEEPPMESLG